MADKRIKDLTVTATIIAAGDYVVMDSAADGTRKILATDLLGVAADYPEVANFAALPAAASYSGALYICLAAQGVFFVSRKPAGLYYSDGATWTYEGDVPDGYFSDSVLEMSDDASPTKKAKFQLSGITAGQTRTMTVPDASGTLLMADTSITPAWVAAPASISASGTAGQASYDTDYLYVCVATNSWKRMTLAQWS